MDDEGPRVLRFKVPALPGELVAENNQREALIDVRDRREKILYFEGEPRFELKFIRRAVTEDENVEVVALQRTADNKYLRLGVDNAGRAGGRASPRRARSCSPIAASSSAASRPARSPAISCA